ncbi:MAG: cyclic nucleotide-binding domain-containing protein [Saprospiraceae bacterium]|nr:cyclic nucleotide-binding domain-containing protein [Saprospiraceae bacterium]
MKRLVVHEVLYGSTYHSRKVRHDALNALLRDHGREIAVVTLRNAPLFGTSDALAEELDKVVQSGVRFVILDLRRVNQVDAETCTLLGEICMQLNEQGCVVGFSHLDPASRFWPAAEEAELTESTDPGHFFADAETALQSFEDLLLQQLNQDFTAQYTMDYDELFGSLGFTDEERRTMRDFFEERTYPQGRIVFSAGSPGDAMYFLASGKADILIDLPDTDRQKRIYTTAYGTVFGEMALLDEQPRSASVVATTDIVCYCLTTWKFNELKQAHPKIAMRFYIVLCHILVNRLRDADGLISQLEEQGD